MRLLLLAIAVASAGYHRHVGHTHAAEPEVGVRITVLLDDDGVKGTVHTPDAPAVLFEAPGAVLRPGDVIVITPGAVVDATRCEWCAAGSAGWCLDLRVVRPDGQEFAYSRVELAEVP